MRTPEAIKELREKIKDLYLKGLSTVAIGKIVEKDHTTITHHLQYMGIKTKKPVITQIQIKNQTFRETQKYKVELYQAMINPSKIENVEQNIFGEKINEGKSYAEYLSEKDKKRYQQLIHYEDKRKYD
jgi:hypothetical protein